MSATATSVLIVTCGDVMLARTCLADLRSIGFRGVTSIGPASAGPDSMYSVPFFGSLAGDVTSRGLLVGGFLGVVASVGVLSIPALNALPVLAMSTVAVASVAAGMSLGGWLARRQLTVREREGASGGDLLLRCEGSAAEIARAARCLEHAPCGSICVAAEER